MVVAEEVVQEVIVHQGYGPSPLQGCALELGLGSYSVTVGAGGAGAGRSIRTILHQDYGANGSDSVLDSITSTGGGGGARGKLMAAGNQQEDQVVEEVVILVVDLQLVVLVILLLLVLLKEMRWNWFRWSTIIMELVVVVEQLVELIQEMQMEQDQHYRNSYGCWWMVPNASSRNCKNWNWWWWNRRCRSIQDLEIQVEQIQVTLVVVVVESRS